MEVGSTTFWLVVGVAVWAMAIIVALTVGWIHGMHKSRQKPTRPEYELGDSINAWQLACAQSLAWSQSRRNGTNVKREVH